MCFGLTHSIVTIADVTWFATGGYARGLRSEELMKKMTNGTGMLTKDEWIGFHEKMFVMLDKKRPALSMRENLSAPAEALTR